MAERSLRFFALHGTPAILAHRHVAQAWEISANYRIGALAWHLSVYLDRAGVPLAPSPELPLPGYRAPSRTRAFVDPAPETLSDGSALVWIAWTMSPRLLAQFARVSPDLSHRQEEALLAASYGRFLDADYPAPPLETLADGKVVDLRVLRPVRHRRLKVWRAMNVLPEARRA